MTDCAIARFIKEASTCRAVSQSAMFAHVDAQTRDYLRANGVAIEEPPMTLRDLLDKRWRRRTEDVKLKGELSALASIAPDEAGPLLLEYGFQCLAAHRDYIGGPSTLGDVMDALADSGFIRVGSGCFGVCVSWPGLDGRVLKFGHRNDDGYAAYAAFCRMHKNKHGPAVYAASRNPYGTGYGVVIERLQDIHEDVDISKDTISTYLYRYLDPARVDFMEWPSDEVYSQYVPETLVMWLEEIREFFFGLTTFDLHADNFMYRADGTLVVTDPMSYSNEGVASRCGL